MPEAISSSNEAVIGDAEPLEIGPDIYQLQLPIPFENGLINVYLFADGATVDLIDCGMAHEESLRILRRAIRQIGGPRAKLGKVLITHAHRDHYGAIGALVDDRSTTAILMHRFELSMVDSHYIAPLESTDELVEHLKRNGMGEDLRRRVLGENEEVRDGVVPRQATVALDGGETARFGVTDLELMWTPGHSPGHLCAYGRASGTLFGGDLVLPNITPNVGLHPESTPNPLRDFINALDMVVELEPTIVCPAHGERFSDLRTRAAELKEHHLRRCEEIEERLDGGPVTAWDLATSIWGDSVRAHPYHNRLALQEVLAHLQSLAVDGLAVKDLGDQTTLWRSAGGIAT